MKILGTEQMSPDQLRFEVQRGGHFVVYTYCVSIVVMSFKRFSAIYFVKEGDATLGRRLGFSLLSLLFGWWGIPWGPIWTIGTIATNLRGGRDVTSQVMAALPARAV